MGYKKLSNEQELVMIEEYKNGASADTLAEKYGFKTRKSVTDKIKKHFPDSYEEIFEANRKIKKGYDYKIESIQNDFDAYLLGLLLTDGYISREKEIGIDLIDEDCIAFLSKSVGKNYKFYNNSSTSLGKNGRFRLIWSVGRESIEKMQRLGVTPNKTLGLQPPQLTENEEEFIPYLVRGLIDGDGSIYKNGYGAPTVSFSCASEDFIYWFKDILEKKLFLKDIVVRKERENFFSFQTANQENILKLISIVYNRPFGMERKYLKIREMFRDYNRDNLLLS